MNKGPMRQTGFVRETGHSLELGKVVAYGLVGAKFRILISREGIDIQGTTPTFMFVGAQVIISYMRRAAIHYEHLISTPMGEPQTILDETEVDVRLLTFEFPTPDATFVNRPSLVKM